jgi:predicted amidophosphoribosyltransferase
LTREERADNVRRAFTPLPATRLPHTRWIVVDDVLTTGATTDAVARVLKRMGAEEVVVWTLARGV